MSERDELITKLRAMRAKCVDGPILALYAHVWVEGNGYNSSEEFGTYGFDGDDEMERANKEFLMTLFNSFEMLMDHPVQYWAWVVQYGTPGKPDIVHGVYKSEEVAIEAVEYMEHYDRLGYCDRYTPVDGMPGQYKSGDRMVFIHRMKFRCKVGV